MPCLTELTDPAVVRAGSPGPRPCEGPCSGGSSGAGVRQVLGQHVLGLLSLFLTIWLERVSLFRDSDLFFILWKGAGTDQEAFQNFTYIRR